jgi:transcriptional regulator
MYSPPAFREDRIDVLHAAIRSIGFGMVITNGPDWPEASHVPMMLVPDPAPYGSLIGHFAKGNPHAGAEGGALAVFAGPHAYISPANYAAKRETGKVVPTWNYIAVHAYGTLQPVADPAALHDIISQLTDHHERAETAPWAVSDAPAEFITAQMKGITGFRLTITRLEGKWKLSQNRPAEDRATIAARLAVSDPAVAEAVAATLT